MSGIYDGTYPADDRFMQLAMSGSDRWAEPLEVQLQKLVKENRTLRAHVKSLNHANQKVLEAVELAGMQYEQAFDDTPCTCGTWETTCPFCDTMSRARRLIDTAVDLLEGGLRRQQR